MLCRCTSPSTNSAIASTMRRKLLVHHKEVMELKMKTEAKGLTLIPLRIYLKKGRIKLELGVCRGKALHDKRDALKKKAVDRDLDRWNRSS